MGWVTIRGYRSINMNTHCTRTLSWGVFGLKKLYQLVTLSSKLISKSIKSSIAPLLPPQEMIKSKLPNNVLGKIWKLSDVDKDGMLDADEFCLAMHLMNVKLDGHDLPTDLPAHLVPPSKRGF